MTIHERPVSATVKRVRESVKEPAHWVTLRRVLEARPDYKLYCWRNKHVGGFTAQIRDGTWSFAPPEAEAEGNIWSVHEETPVLALDALARLVHSSRFAQLLNVEFGNA